MQVFSPLRLEGTKNHEGRFKIQPIIFYRSLLLLGKACLPAGKGDGFFTHKRKIISAPKSHFYTELSGQAVLHLDILHFQSHEFTNCFTAEK